MTDYILLPYFQPIVSMSDKEIYGYEVLARGRERGGRMVMPGEIFTSDEPEKNLDIDRRIRELAVEMAAVSSISCPLFFNVSPHNLLMVQNVEKESQIYQLTREYDIPPEKIVIEITEKTAEGIQDIAAILDEYKKFGFRIAIDDWGAGYSNFERLSRILPDMVKIDAGLLWSAVSDRAIAEIFCSAVSMITHMGIQVIAEGVENLSHMYMVLESGCSRVQGYFLAEPAPVFQENNAFSGKLNSVFSRYRKGRINNLLGRRQRIDSYINAVNYAFCDMMRTNITYEELFARVKDFMIRKSVIGKAYILDINGLQVSPNMKRDNGFIAEDLTKMGKDWSWRPYYLESIVNREALRSRATVTGPYLDPEIGKNCYTVSLMIDPFIICIDFHED